MSKSRSPFADMRVQNNFLVFKNYEKITALLSLQWPKFPVSGMTRVIENFESNSLIENFHLPYECKRQHFSCKFSQTA